MADPMQQARELLAETLDAIADDTRYHALNGEQHDHLREAAAALRAAPEGFVLVPVVPTPEMDAHGRHALSKNGVDSVDDSDALVCWSAMLAARPQGVKP